MRSQVKNIFDEFQIKDWGDTSDQDQKTRQRLNVAKMDPLEMYQLMDEEMNKEGGEETRERYTYEGRWWPRTRSTRSKCGEINSDAFWIASWQSVWAP